MINDKEIVRHPFITKEDEAVKSPKSDGTVKSFSCKARKSDGMRRTYLYAANDSPR